MKYGLSEKQLKEITDILASYKAVEKAILFGSRAIDTYKEASDVDIAIKGENADWSLAMTIKDHLEEETYLPFFFDVVAYGCIESEELRRHIDGKGKVLFERGWSQWRECELREVAEVQTGPFGSQLKNEQYITGGTPVITVEHINNFRIDDFDYPSVTDEDKNRLAKYLLKAGDIIFTRVGSVDLSAFVKPHQDGWMFSSRMLRVRPIHEVDSRFLSYFFQQKRFREYILNISVGATMPSINTEILKGIPVAYPPLPEQKAIAEVLSALDDKIDLLHRQNKTLEQMAETLFRQWFVVEAGVDWEEGGVSDLIDFNPKRILAKGAVATYLEMASLNTQTFHPDSWYDREFKSGTKFINEDTLLARITPCLENGKTAYVTFLQDNQVAWGSTEYIVMRPKQGIHPFFAYVLARNSDFREYAEGCLAGSSGRQRIDLEHLKNFDIPIPSKKIIEDFNSNLAGIVPKLMMNAKQIRTLQSLRDTLLPKLMSGEIRVKYDDK